jgi:hypothetical protein
MAVTWIACYRKKVAHAVPADVHSSAYDHTLDGKWMEITVAPTTSTPTDEQH